MSENLLEVRNLILSMYQLAEFKPEEAQDYTDVNCEIHKEIHAEWLSKQFKQLSKGMIGQDSGQPWFLFWLTNGIEICNQN